MYFELRKSYAINRVKYNHEMIENRFHDKEDPLNLYLMLDGLKAYQNKYVFGNVMNHLKEENIEKIYEWYDFISDQSWRDKWAKDYVSNTKGLLDGFPKDPNLHVQFLSRTWELHVAVELIKQRCEIVGYEVENKVDKKLADFLVRKNDNLFIVECKLKYGSEEKIKEVFKPFMGGLGLTSGFHRQRPHDLIMLNVKKEVGDKVKNFEHPVMVAFCMIDDAVISEIRDGKIPDTCDFADIQNVAKTENNVHAIWHCSNYCQWWPENTRMKSFVLYDPKSADSDLVNVIQELELFEDLSSLVVNNHCIAIQLI